MAFGKKFKGRLDKIAGRAAKRKGRKINRAAKREERVEKRGAKIEARRGLAKGEGKKVIENRKQRRKELFKAPNTTDGSFTKKYRGESAESRAKKDTRKRLDKAITPTDNTTRLLNGGTLPLAPKSGGGFAANSMWTPDRGDIRGNVQSVWMRKKGY